MYRVYLWLCVFFIAAVFVCARFCLEHASLAAALNSVFFLTLAIKTCPLPPSRIPETCWHERNYDTSETYPTEEQED